MINYEEISNSFKNYVNEDLIKLLNNKKIYKMPINLNGIDAENTFLELVCKYLVNQIRQIFDFEQIKVDYREQSRKIHPNLSYNKLNKRKQDLEKNLMIYAKLKYCLEQIEKFGYGLVVADYLFIILEKLSMKYKKEINLPNDLLEYLFYATIEVCYRDINEESRKSFDKIVNALFCNIIATNKSRKNILLTENEFNNEIVVPEYLVSKIEENDDLAVINKIEKAIYQDLVDEMHTINGKYF